MSEFNDFRDEEGDEAAEAADEAPHLFYGSSDEFVREHLIHM